MLLSVFLYTLDTFLEIFYHFSEKEINVTFSFRSSRSELFCKKGFLKNFAKFTGKHVCQSLFFNRVADLRPATLFKKRLWYRRFSVNFAKFLKTPIFIEHSGGCFCSLSSAAVTLNKLRLG